MTAADLTGVRGPVIERDGHSAPFFDAARRGELVIPRCRSCERWLGPQDVTCTGCGGADTAWRPVGGDAELVTWAVVHSPPHRAFADQLPYVTGFVELAEGPWLAARIVADPGLLHAGTALAVAFVHPDEGESYPVFVPFPRRNP